MIPDPWARWWQEDGPAPAVGSPCPQAHCPSVPTDGCNGCVDCEGTIVVREGHKACEACYTYWDDEAREGNWVKRSDVLALFPPQAATPHADTERLDFLLDSAPFDEFGGRDVHEEALRVAERACGRGKEPTPVHYRVAYRILIDAARSTPPATGTQGGGR